MAAFDLPYGRQPANTRRPLKPAAEAGQLATANTAQKARLPWPVLLYLLAVVTPVQFDLGPLALSAVRCLLLVMIVPLTINLLRGRYGRLLWTDFLFFLHIFWMLVSLLYNNPDRAVQLTGSVGIEFLGGYLLARGYIRSAETFSALCRALAIIAIATLPFAIHETLTGEPVIIETIKKIPGLRSEGDVQNELRLGLERVQTVFAHPIHYGLFSSVVFSLIFVGLKHQLSFTRRWFMSALTTACVFLALSSGALLALILQLFLIVWNFIFRSIRSRWYVLAAIVVLLYVAVDLLSNRSPIKVFMSYATFSPHNAYWRGLIFEYGIQNVWANPVFGLGLNDWVRPFWMWSPSVDNFWLLMAMQYGVPGFLFIALGYGIALFRIGRRRFSDPVLIDQRRAWMFTFTGLTFTLSTVHVWASVYSFVFFMFGAGMWFISQRDTPGQNEEPPASPSAAARNLKTPHRRATRQDDPTSSPVDNTSQGPHYTRFPTQPKRKPSSQNDSRDKPGHREST